MRLAIFDENEEQILDFDMSSVEPVMRSIEFNKDQIVEILDLLEITIKELEDSRFLKQEDEDAR